MASKQAEKFSFYPVRILGYALICLPVVASFLYVKEFGVNVPFTDTWRMVPYFEKLFNGELSLGDLWEKHSGEHRPALPRVFLLLMGPLASFNMITIMYATQLCLLAVLGVVLLAYRETVGSDNKALFFAIPLSLLVFSLGQYWNTLHAWSIHVVVVNSFAVLSFLLLSRLWHKGRRGRIISSLAAMFCGSAATLSAGHGLMIWPVGFVQILIEPVSVRSKRYLLGLWAMVGILHWIVYFRNFDSSSSRMSQLYFVNSPRLGLDYFLSLTGFSLFSGLRLAAVTGAIILLLLVVAVFQIAKNQELGKHTFWISLSLFSLAVLAATTVGRAGKGLDGSVHSKYVTFSVLLTIGVYIMVLKLARDHSSGFSTLILGGFISLIVLSTPLSYYSGLVFGEELKIEREEKACVLVRYENVSNETLQQAFRPLRSRPDIGKEVRRNAAILDDLDYSVFALSTSETQREFRC